MTARTAREEEEEGAEEEGSKRAGAVFGRFLGGLSPRCEGPEGLASARAPPGEEGLARSMESWGARAGKGLAAGGRGRTQFFFFGDGK